MCRNFSIQWDWCKGKPTVENPTFHGRMAMVSFGNPWEDGDFTQKNGDFHGIYTSKLGELLGCFGEYEELVNGCINTFKTG